MITTRTSDHSKINLMGKIPVDLTLYSAITKKKITDTYSGQYGLFAGQSASFTKKYVIYQHEDEFAVFKMTFNLE